MTSEVSFDWTNACMSSFSVEALSTLSAWRGMITKDYQGRFAGCAVGTCIGILELLATSIVLVEGVARAVITAVWTFATGILQTSYNSIIGALNRSIYHIIGAVGIIEDSVRGVFDPHASLQGITARNVEFVKECVSSVGHFFGFTH